MSLNVNYFFQTSRRRQRDREHRPAGLQHLGRGLRDGQAGLGAAALHSQPNQSSRSSGNNYNNYNNNIINFLLKQNELKFFVFFSMAFELKFWYKI